MRNKEREQRTKKENREWCKNEGTKGGITTEKIHNVLQRVWENKGGRHTETQRHKDASVGRDEERIAERDQPDLIAG